MIPSQTLRSIALRVAVYPVLAYLVAGVYFYVRQGSLLFPAPTEYGKTTPADIRVVFEDLRIPVQSSGEMHAWWIPAAVDAPRTILVFHGNGYVIEQMLADELPRLRRLDANPTIADTDRVRPLARTNAR